MDSSLQVTVVTGNGLVASNGNRDNSRGSMGVGSVGVADDGSNNSGLRLSLPLAVVSVAVGVSVSITVAESVAIVSSVQEVRVSLSLGVCLLGSHCQQKKSGKRHCSSVVSLDCPH